MFDGAIKAQWSDHCFVVLFKAAKLDFFACPSTDRAMLLGFMDAIERRLSEALNQTDESDDEETEEEEDLHLKHLLDCWKGPTLAYMTILFLELRCGNFLPFWEKWLSRALQKKCEKTTQKVPVIMMNSRSYQ